VALLVLLAVERNELENAPALLHKIISQRPGHINFSPPAVCLRYLAEVSCSIKPAPQTGLLTLKTEHLLSLYATSMAAQEAGIEISRKRS
jgi:hypothetical protein